MNRDDLVDLNAFVAVAEERSFTRAAARLQTSQSALRDGFIKTVGHAAGYSMGLPSQGRDCLQPARQANG